MEDPPREDVGAQGLEPEKPEPPTDEVVDVADLGFVGDSRPVRQTFVETSDKIVSRQESTRAALAFSLTALLALLLLISLARADSWEDIKQLLDLAVPAVAGLLGSAIGFYFGAKN